MKILVDVEKIKKLASNNKVFIRGRNLFNAKERVGPMYFDGDKRLLMARISSFSGNVYDTVIHLHNNGSPEAVSCSCRSFGTYKGLCKHSIALLFSSLQQEFSDDGEWPEVPEDHPLVGIPQLKRPLIPIEDLMHIEDPGAREEKKRRGRPAKKPEDQAKPESKQVPTGKMDDWLQDRTEVIETEGDSYIPFRGKPAEQEVVAVVEENRKPELSRAQRYMVALNRWENREDNIVRSLDILQRQNAAIIMEFTIDLLPGLGDGSQLSVRVGTDEHLYVVNQLGTFLEAIGNAEEISFGTYFSWQKDQRLSDFQQYSMEWLQRNFFESKRQEECMTRHSWVNGKYMTLTSEMLRDFLRLARQTDDGVKVVFQFMGQEFPFVLRDRFPQGLRLYLEEVVLDDTESRENSFSISLHENERPIALAYLGDEKAKQLPIDGMLLLHDDFICIYDSVVYMLKGREDRFLWQAIKLLAESPRNKFHVNSSELSYFLAVANGFQTETQCVEFSDGLQKKIVEMPLQIRSYLDYIDGVIWLSSFFFYGDYYFRPFYRNEAAREQKKEVTDKLIVRDGTAERRFESLVESSDFRQVSLKPEELAMISQSKNGDYMANQFYIKGDEGIFRFYVSGIQGIQEESELFVSPAFRKLEVIETGESNIVLDYNENAAWMDVNINMEGFSEEDAAKVIHAFQEDAAFVRLDEQRIVNLHKDASRRHKKAEQMRKLVQTLSSWGATWVDGRFRVSKYRSFALQSFLDQESMEVQTGTGMEDRWKQLISDQQNPALSAPALPAGIQADLRPYQMQAFQWLSFLDRYGMGGILADEMGLGKTLEMLSFLWNKYAELAGQILIIAPTSLIYNWEAEVHRFIPGLPCTVIGGTKSQRIESYNNLLNKNGLMIISYGIARQDKLELKEFAFSFVIIDEAQNIKNPMTKTARAVKAISAGGRFALTGTPIENHIGELWSIFDFIMPGYLFSYRTFQERFSQKEAQDSLHQLVSPFIMRRLKQDVLSELPDKIVTDIPCKMTPEQQALYRVHLQRARQGLLALDKAAGENKNRKRMDILGELTRLRQICCDPALFVDHYTGGSGKLEVLEDLVQNLLDGNHRILIFSQFTTMLHTIQERQEPLGRRVMYIDGKVQAKDRVDLVDRFNAGEGDIFLISLKAGGTGLNLTGADVVIHYDPWWNPAVENQATDRAHRLGQRKVVQVFRLVTIGSIEEKIQEMQERKQALLDDIVAPGATFIHRMDLDDIRELFADNGE